MAAMTAAPTKKWTPEDYLSAERVASQKHEYFGGEIFAMAGATERHDTITANVTTALGTTLGGEAYRPHTPDMRIHIPATGLYTYSDGLAVCGAQLTDATRDTLVNPAVIFEVLSDSTEGYDRGRKFDNYRSIPSLQEYVLVSQHEVLVEHFVRQSDGTWNLRVLRAGQVLRLTGVPIEIPVDDLYLWAFDKQPGCLAAGPDLDAHPRPVLAATRLRAVRPSQIARSAGSGRGLAVKDDDASTRVGATSRALMAAARCRSRKTGFATAARLYT